MNNTASLSNVPAKRSGLLITQIDHPASAALCQSVGECVASNHGLHTVIRGTDYCAKCGAR